MYSLQPTAQPMLDGLGWLAILPCHQKIHYCPLSYVIGEMDFSDSGLAREKVAAKTEIHRFNAQVPPWLWFRCRFPPHTNTSLPRCASIRYFAIVVCEVWFVLVTRYLTFLPKQHSPLRTQLLYPGSLAFLIIKSLPPPICLSSLSLFRLMPNFPVFFFSW